MHLDVLQDKELRRRYHRLWNAGEVVFSEGDPNQDLHVLLSGRLEVLKGQQKITELCEPGTVFGEMSWLLGAPRTATVRAQELSETLAIPRELIPSFLHEFPEAAQEISRHLAQRLDQTTQVLHGLKEFCDHLPDAVILSDAQGGILAFNAAAVELYGRDWGQMQGQPVETVYEEPQAYRAFLREAEATRTAKEKVLKVRHPARGPRLASTSITILRDPQNNLLGSVSLARDVTKAEETRRRYRLAMLWLVPSLLLLAGLAVGAYWAYPHFDRGFQSEGRREALLQSQMAKDFLLLASLLKADFAPERATQAKHLIRQFFEMQGAEGGPYQGVVLLGPEKAVLAAHARQPGRFPEPTTGSTYANLNFQAVEGSLHRVLVCFRPSPSQPGGVKSVEVAMEVLQPGGKLGWLVLQMDLGYLERQYGLHENGLFGLRFPKPLTP